MKKKVLIFAASGYGLKVVYHLGEEYEVVAIIDNSPLYNGKWGGVQSYSTFCNQGL